MNFLALFRKPAPSHAEPRYYAATKAENAVARQRRADVRMELEMMAVHLTDDQKARAIQQAKRGRG